MFTVEIKINGALIGALYGHNEGTISGNFGEDLCKYRFSYWVPETGRIINGTHAHVREAGMLALVQDLINKITILQYCEEEPPTSKTQSNAGGPPYVCKLDGPSAKEIDRLMREGNQRVDECAAGNATGQGSGSTEKASA